MSVPFRFIHAADLHVDSPFRGLTGVPEPVREALTQSTFAAVKRLTDAAIEREADFVVIAGDLYDEADSSLRAQLALHKEWSRLSGFGIAVYAIHGNHDHLGGMRARLELPGNVHIFGADAAGAAPAYRRSGEQAAVVYGQSYGERAVRGNMAAAYRPIPADSYHIALLHGNVGGDPQHDAYAPCSLEQLAGGGFDYWALGHIHQRRVLSEYPHIVYPGNPQGRNPRETGAKGCYVVDVDERRRTSLTFVPLDGVRWLELEVPIAGADTEQELLARLEAAAAEAGRATEGRSVMLRLKLTGRGALHDRLSEPSVLRTLLEQLQEAEDFAGGETWTYVYEIAASTDRALDWAALAQEDSFAGELLRLAGRLREDGGQWRSFAQTALRPAASHARLGRLQRDKWEEPPERWLREATELAADLLAGQRRSRQGE